MPATAVNTQLQAHYTSRRRRRHLASRRRQQPFAIADPEQEPHHEKAVSILSKAIKEILGRIFPTLGTRGDHYNRKSMHGWVIPLISWQQIYE